MKEKKGFISIIIPCRNEEKFIGRCLDSIAAQQFPKEEFEILVVDGESTDQTKQIINCYCQRYHFIHILENKKRITPVALNIGIKNAKGDIIIRMDAHAEYRPDYVLKCVSYLEEYNADNVGGIIITLPMESGFMGKSIVAALSSKFGVGNSTFRTGSNEPKWVDTVFGGCYRKELFDRIGLFNEELSSTQDMEFNLRLKKAGGKILLHPDIIANYYTRSDLSGFCRNNFRNGFWAVYPMKFVKHMPVSLRHLIPLFFVSSIVLLPLFALAYKPFFYIFLVIVTSYVLVSLFFSFKIALKKTDWRYFLTLPAVFLMIHIPYGFGSVCAGIKLLFSLKK